jgi:signal peptidase I
LARLGQTVAVTPRKSRSRALVVGVVAAVTAAFGLGVAIWLVAGRGGDEADDAPSTVYPMSGTGMEPTLSHGDPVVASEIDGGEVDRGDVVVVEVPSQVPGEPTLVVKRVVAVAGEEIEGAGGEVLIDGRPADESYLAPGTVTENLTRQEIPAGHVFVLGDNRANSHDSRQFGPVPGGNVVAVVDAS